MICTISRLSRFHVDKTILSKYFIFFDIPDVSEDQGGEQPPQRRRTLSVDETHRIQANRNHDYDPGAYIQIK